jgi:hypothetical protein
MPPFPQKKPTLFVDHSSEDFVQERRVNLDFWLKALVARYIDLDFVQQFFDLQNTHFVAKKE